MNAMLKPADVAETSRTAAPVRTRVIARLELDDFRRTNYADGWDDDDAALGWVDEDIVTRGKKRTAH
ncbi:MULTISPECIES: hypothetical protein [unclassified Lysobacter]